MTNFKKTMAGILVTAGLCFSLGYALPVSADSTNTQIQINSNLRRTHISPEEYAFSSARGTCVMVEHQTFSRYFKVYYEPGIIESGELNKVWQNYKIGTDSINNVAYLSYSLMNCESAALEEMAKNVTFELVDIANGVNPIRQMEKYRAYGDVAGYRLLFAEAELSNEPSLDVKAFAGEKWIKGTEVRMRAKPNTDCDVLGYFDYHENLRVLGYVDGEGSSAYPGNWAYVRRDNGAEGFVAAQFVASGPAIEDFDQHLLNHIQNSGKYESWKNLNYKLTVIDTYCGEGPRAVATKKYKVSELRDGNEIVLAFFHVSDNGNIGKEVNDYIVRDN